MTNNKYFQRLLAITFVVAAWEITSLIAGSKYFPHFSTELKTLGTLATSGAFWHTTLVTLALTFTAFMCGISIALVIGAVLGLLKSVELHSRATLNFLRTIPIVAILPILIGGFGLSEILVISLTSAVVALKFLIYVVRGIQSSQNLYAQDVKLMRLPKHVQILQIYFPSTLTLLAVGARLSFELALSTVVICGLFVGTAGLGSALLQAETNSNISLVFAYVIVLGAIGVGINSLFSKCEKMISIRVGQNVKN